MTLTSNFRRRTQPRYFSRADDALEAVLDALSEKLTALPENEAGEELVRATTPRGVFRMICMNREGYGDIDGPVQKVLTVYYGDDTRTATAQCYAMRDEASRNLLTANNIIAPKSDTPEGWRTLVTDWAKDVYGPAIPCVAPLGIQSFAP